jgi:hypothetical protein
MQTAYGLNLGHGYVKCVAIDGVQGALPPVVFPSLITPAQASVSGALSALKGLSWGGRDWWVGEGALRVESPRSFLGQDRLDDRDFIPLLARQALGELDIGEGSRQGYCVTGLPASWALDGAKRKQLGELLRSATTSFSRIWVIPEPLGLIYAVALDADGQEAGDRSLLDGTVAVVDGGHLTLDLAIVSHMTPLSESLRTYQLGTARPLGIIQAQLQAHFDRELSLHQVDEAIRAGGVLVAGRRRPLPPRWDAPLIEAGEVLVSRLAEALGSGGQLDAILLGGGFAHLPQLTIPLLTRYGHAQVVPEPQLAVARGYARFARRKLREDAR